MTIRDAYIAARQSSLFDTREHTLLTVIIALAFAAVAAAVVMVMIPLVEGWALISGHSRQLLVGGLSPDHDSRIYAHLYVVAAFGGVAWGYLGRFNALLAAVGLVLAFITLSVDGALAAKLLLLGLLGAVGVSFVVGHYLLRGWQSFGNNAGRWFGIGWIGVLIYTPVILNAFGGVPISALGGFYLNVMLAMGIVSAATPIGLLLALGATPGMSPRPVRFLARIYIDIVRGLPLLPLLIFAFLIDDSVLSKFGVPAIDPLYRIAAVFTMFTGAYIAVGLHSSIVAVPIGQIEAARTLGLTKLQIWTRIILVQALRPVVPFLLSQFTNVLAATSLVALVGQTDLLGAALGMMEDSRFAGYQPQLLFIVATMFWLAALILTRASRRLEQWLGQGAA